MNLNNLNTLDHIDVTNKKILLRVDLNVPVKNSNISDNTRIERIIPTIRELVHKKAIVIIASHFGRPTKDMNEIIKKEKFSLNILLKPLSEYLGQPITFIEDYLSPNAIDNIKSLNPGDIVLLENLRFHEEEEKNDESFSKNLARLADYYVNDAFSCSHRAHASIVGITQFLPAFAGRSLENELKALHKIMDTPERPLTAITGGSKVSTKLSLLNHLVEKVDFLIIAGAMANTFLVAQGHSIGQSMFEPDMIDIAKDILKKAPQHGCHIVLPEDGVVATDLIDSESIRTTKLADIQPGEKYFDIGPLTMANIEQTLHNSKTVVWNGPLGVFEVPPFDFYSCKLAEILGTLTLEEKIVSIAGGGDTLACLKKTASSDVLTYTSTAGGAFLEWLEGNTLTGIVPLLTNADVS